MASPLQREIQQQRPFPSAEAEAVLNLTRTADRAARAMAGLFKRHGLSQPQYNVLRILRGAAPDGLPCLEVRARMVAQVPDVTRLLDRLEAQGLVTRTRSADDRRVVRANITPRGVRLLAKLGQPVEDLHHALLGHLTSRELKQLNALLVKARQQPPEA